MLSNKNHEIEIGRSGTSITAGIFTDEYLSNLQGYQAADVYNKMRRSDGQVRKVLSAIIKPIKAGTWEIRPASNDESDMKTASLVEQILFKDINFDSKLDEILTCIPHGHSVFEPVHQNFSNNEIGQYTGLKSLAFRAQSSLIRWNFNRSTGLLESIDQLQSGDVWVNVTIPSDLLLIFTIEKEGDNNGFPICRPMYGAYKRKLLMQELKMIGIERSAIPTPKVKIPASVDVNSEEYINAKSQIASFTSAENSYLMYPEGWEVDLVTNTFDPSRLEASIKAENEEMAGSIIASFLELGTGGNGGAYALGNDLSDFFLSVIESFPRSICATINRELIPSLVKLNYGDKITKYPELVCSNIADKAGKEFMEVLTGFTRDGLINPDEQIEDYVRKKYNLPKRPEGTVLEKKEIKDDNGTSGGDDNNSGPSNSDNNITTDDSNPDNKNDNPDKEKNLQMAEKGTEAKTARGLIVEQGDKVHILMQDNLKFISEKYIADVLRNYKSLPDGSKLKAIDNVKIGGTAIFKRQLKGMLSSIANMSIDQAKEETGIKNIKFKDNPEIIKALDPKGEFKFQDRSKLPRHVQLLINRQAEISAEKQIKDVTDAVAFKFTSNEATIKDPNVLKMEMDRGATDYIEGGTVSRGAVNLVSSTVNDSRYQFFFDPEVLPEIDSFTFMNPDPKSDICKSLAGTTFPASNADMLAYNPPLHHNCKSYLSANLVGSKKKVDYETGTPSLSKSAIESITLKETNGAKNVNSN